MTGFISEMDSGRIFVKITILTTFTFGNRITSQETNILIHVKILNPMLFPVLAAHESY